MLPSPAHQASFAVHYALHCALPAHIPQTQPPSALATGSTSPATQAHTPGPSHDLAATVRHIAAKAHASDFSQIAVLYRRNKSGAPLAAALKQLGIPFNRRGTAPHHLGSVRDVMACCTVVALEQQRAQLAGDERACAAAARACCTGEDAGGSTEAGRPAEHERPCFVGSAEAASAAHEPTMPSAQPLGGHVERRQADDAAAPRRHASLRPEAQHRAEMRLLRGFLQRQAELRELGADVRLSNRPLLCAILFSCRMQHGCPIQSNFVVTPLCCLCRPACLCSWLCNTLCLRLVVHVGGICVVYRYHSAGMSCAGQAAGHTAQRTGD